MRQWVFSYFANRRSRSWICIRVCISGRKCRWQHAGVPLLISRLCIICPLSGRPIPSLKRYPRAEYCYRSAAPFPSACSSSSPRGPHRRSPVATPHSAALHSTAQQSTTPLLQLQLSSDCKPLSEQQLPIHRPTTLASPKLATRWDYLYLWETAHLRIASAFRANFDYCTEHKSIISDTVLLLARIPSGSLLRFAAHSKSTT